MKKNILIFGLLSGIILMAFIFAFLFIGHGGAHSWAVGYGAMIIAFSFIYVAIRNYRDKFNEGMVSFGRAFLIGLSIALIGSTFYVLTWVIGSHYYMPNFMDKYAAQMIAQARSSGLSPAELDKKITAINSMSATYKNPVWMVLMTYMEVLPVGIVIALICAAILKRKVRGGTAVPAV